MIEIVRTGLLVTVQDLGRPGYAHLGVGHSGAADPVSLRLANRLVGNAEDAAGLEVTFGGAALRFTSPAWVAVTGAPAPVHPYGMNVPCHVPAGTVLEIGMPLAGVRTYVAVRGGVDVRPVLGSRSTDLLAGLGPAPPMVGDRLAVGATDGLAEIIADHAPGPAFDDLPLLAVLPGPRDDRFHADALSMLARDPYEVSPASDRTGVRLIGTGLPRLRDEELPSEGMVSGALQVPPDGYPIILLADHPTTGGYPVIGVLAADDVPRAGRLRPGQRVHFRVVRRDDPA